MGVSMGPDELLPGENAVLAKNANALIRADEHGLSRLAYDHVLGAAGLRGVDGIGGRLHLTNYRLVFKSHAANRVRGTFSVFLPTVREARNTSSGIKRQLEVGTDTQRFTFVVWGVPALIAAIERGRDALDPAAVSALADLAFEHGDRLGDGLKKSDRIEAVNRALSSWSHPLAGVAPAQPGPVALTGLSQAGVSSSLNLAELVELSRADARPDSADQA
jgi:hypothetical protein